jgi:hypothetical protein
LLAILVLGCKKDDSPVMTSVATPKDPNTAPKAVIDRFSAEAGNLFVRTSSNGLPGSNQAINFDQGPFITQGFGPTGQIVKYYNFDVQPGTPAPIYVLFHDGETSPVSGQLNIVDVIPGDSTYNDFWQVVKVTVPVDYVANVVTSKSEIIGAGYPMTMTTTIVNCPIVPDGSTATLRMDGGDAGLVRGWYRGQVVEYFTFNETALMTTSNNTIPLSPIYVCFNINPGQTGGGPESGFKMESGSPQTHNAVATIPGDATYSPYWNVNVYDNADFNSVSDYPSAQGATTLAIGVATVNCPIVSVQ